MKKFAILAGLMSLALVIGVAGTSFNPGKAQAKATDVIAINPDVCASIMGQFDSTVVLDCYSLNVPADLAAVADVLGGSVDNVDTYKDLVDASAAQLGEDATDATCGTNPTVAPCSTLIPGLKVRTQSQSMWVLTFVTNDALLTEDADAGVWLSTFDPSAVPAIAGPASSTQSACPFGDADCDANAATVGDGVVVDLLYSGSNSGADTLDRGDAQVVNTQSGVDVTLDYTVVGAPDDFTLEALKTSLQSDGGTCELPNYHDAAAYTAIVGQPDVAGLLGTAVDDDGTKLTGIWVGWFTTDTDVADVALNTGTASSTDRFEHTATIASGTVVAAPNLACGIDSGDVTIHAGVLPAFGDITVAGPLTDNAPSFLLGIDSNNVGDVLNPDDTAKLTVIGAPSTMTLANPAQITCDGVNSAEVDATVLNSDGKPVSAGNKVRFDVVALGTAKPIVAVTDANGVAKTTVTPLSGVTAGVTVIATVEGQEVILNDNLELSRTDVTNTDTVANALVSCAPAVPTAAPPPVGPVGPSVTPPRTGDGGYLP
jgi:hypothetical protein